MKNIKIVDIIKSEFAVSPEDGDIIYNLASENIKNNDLICIDFSGVDITTTAFLNNAIGTLYKEFDTDILNKFITMSNISDSDLALVKKVIDRAKLTFTDEALDKLGDELGDE